MGDVEQVDASTDALRERLLDAAVRVFAAKGYDGTKIMDIVREAGLSTGAIYGRFSSKDELLREAVTRRARRHADPSVASMRVTDLIARIASDTTGELSDDDAVRLEAHVAARRVPEVAEALAVATAEWRDRQGPLFRRALKEGSVGQQVDPEAVLFFVTTLRMGLLAQRAAGVDAPDPDAWRHLVDLIISSFGDDASPS